MLSKPWESTTFIFRGRSWLLGLKTLHFYSFFMFVFNGFWESKGKIKKNKTMQLLQEFHRTSVTTAQPICPAHRDASFVITSDQTSLYRRGSWRKKKNRKWSLPARNRCTIGLFEFKWWWSTCTKHIIYRPAPNTSLKQWLKTKHGIKHHKTKQVPTTTSKVSTTTGLCATLWAWCVHSLAIKNSMKIMKEK